MRKSPTLDDASAVARALKSSVPGSSIVLIGSVARSCAMQRSDLDVLIMGDEQPHVRLRLPNVEIHRYSRFQFLAEMKNGDDFPAWCARYGVPLEGAGYWREVLDSAADTQWPEWKRKFESCARRMIASELLLKTDDVEGAHEAALFALDHLIRGVLLKQVEFPLSRPELSEQIKGLSPVLSKGLKRVLSQGPNRSEVRRTLKLLWNVLKDEAPELHDRSLDRIREMLSGRASETIATETTL